MAQFDLQAAQYCQLAYQLDPFLINEIRYQTDDLAVIYGLDALGHDWLVFRGTVSRNGWLTDIDARLIPHPDFCGYVHSGFASAFNEISHWIEENCTMHSDCIVTGHSLGGALATLTSQKYDLDCITFGCPRVGDETFAGAYSANQRRFVHDLDPVPHVPSLPFHHVCDEIHIGPSYLQAAWNHLFKGFRAKLVDSVEDHAISNYVRLLA